MLRAFDHPQPLLGQKNAQGHAKEGSFKLRFFDGGGCCKRKLAVMPKSRLKREGICAGLLVRVLQFRRCLGLMRSCVLLPTRFSAKAESKLGTCLIKRHKLKNYAR